jgi:hypothetical protein
MILKSSFLDKREVKNAAEAVAGTLLYEFTCQLNQRAAAGWM